MGSDELIANSFRISQTEQKLKKDNVKEESIANKKNTLYNWKKYKKSNSQKWWNNARRYGNAKEKFKRVRKRT